MKNSIVDLNVKEIKNVFGGEGCLIFVGYILSAAAAYFYETYRFYHDRKQKGN